MKLNSPKQITWYISLIIGVLAILSAVVTIPFVTDNALWFMAIAWLLMMLATALKGL